MADSQIQLNAIITQPGLDAAINVFGSSMSVTVTHIAVGDGSYQILDAEGKPLTSAANRTSLANERARMPIGQSKKIDDANGFITAARFGTGGPEYTVREVGLYANDMLFAVWSDPTTSLQHKVPHGDMIVRMGLVLDRVPTGTVTVMSDGSLNLLMDGEMAAQAAATIHLQTHQLDTLMRLRAFEGKGA